MKKRHIFYYKFFRALVTVFVKIRFGYKYRLASNLPDNYIVISNHTTDYDLLFVASSFKKQMYFVGSEHIARWGFFSKFLKYCFDPIFRSKGASALSAVLEMYKKLKKGASVCLFAEGVRSWDGVTCPISRSTADLVKNAKCGLVTYKIVGGYFVSPMWAGASVRRGKIEGSVVNVYTKEQLAEMTADEVYDCICRDVQEDAYERQLASPEKYKGKRLAEGLERMLFICPECKAKDTLVTSGDTVECTHCHHKFTYDEYGMLNGTRFKTLKEYSDWQKAEVQKDAVEGVKYCVDGVTLSTVKNHVEEQVAVGNLFINGEAMVCADKSFELEGISDIAIHGQRALVFTFHRDYYELIFPENTNALKFLLYYNARQKITEKAEVEA